MNSQITYNLVEPTSQHNNSVNMCTNICINENVMKELYRSIGSIVMAQNMEMWHMECDFFCDVLIKINKYAEFHIFYFCSYFHSLFFWSSTSHLPIYTHTHTRRFCGVVSRHSRSHAFIKFHCISSSISRKSLWKIVSHSTRFIINCPTATWWWWWWWLCWWYWLIPKRVQLLRASQSTCYSFLPLCISIFYIYKCAY